MNDSDVIVDERKKKKKSYTEEKKMLIICRLFVCLFFTFRMKKKINKTTTGLHFLFDVKTTLAIADLAFFPSRTSHSYDLYASSSSKEDILLVNLQDGKVEMITGIGEFIRNQFLSHTKKKNNNNNLLSLSLSVFSACSGPSISWMGKFEAAIGERRSLRNLPRYGRKRGRVCC